MNGGLGYQETVALLRAALARVEGNAWGFHVRGRGQPGLLSSRGWLELAEIESLLGERLHRVFREDLHQAPSTVSTRLASRWRGLRIALGRERRVLEALWREVGASPVERWRRDAPQLEASLWPFFVERTHHLANTLALALDRPAPHPAILWHPGRREFRG